MYRKYFEYENLLEYNFLERKAINKCRNDTTSISELYKREYIRYSRYV